MAWTWFEGQLIMYAAAFLTTWLVTWHAYGHACFGLMCLFDQPKQKSVRLGEASSSHADACDRFDQRTFAGLSLQWAAMHVMLV